MGSGVGAGSCADSNDSCVVKALIPRRSILACLGGALTVVLADPARAQIALYEGRLPDGYAYVRFVNTMALPIDIVVDGLGKIGLGVDEAARISSYYVIENVAGKNIQVTNGQGSVGLSLVPGKFHTVLLDGIGTTLSARLVVDVTEYNQLRAKLSFYNVIPTCHSASLILEPSGQAVFPAVAFGTMRTRSINPIDKALVSARCDATTLLSLDLGELHEGALYSVWMMAPAGTPAIFLSQDLIAPYQK